jgi:hypothetical protein
MYTSRSYPNTFWDEKGNPVLINKVGILTNIRTVNLPIQGRFTNQYIAKFNDFILLVPTDVIPNAEVKWFSQKSEDDGVLGIRTDGREADMDD